MMRREGCYHEELHDEKAGTTFLSDGVPTRLRLVKLDQSRLTSLYPHVSIIFIRLACQMWVSSHLLLP
jgi:hypothetical protein